MAILSGEPNPLLQEQLLSRYRSGSTEDVHTFLTYTFQAPITLVRRLMGEGSRAENAHEFPKSNAWVLIQPMALRSPYEWWTPLTSEGRRWFPRQAFTARINQPSRNRITYPLPRHLTFDLSIIFSF